MQGYTISTDPGKMDFDIVYSFISNTYWAKGIPKPTLQKALSHSFCFGIFDALHQQVGFARLITDKATFAYLADVFVLESHQNKGLGKWLVDNILAHPDLQGLRRILLATKDAHTLYSRFGFKPLDQPETLMHIWQPDVYTQKPDDV